MRKGTNVGKAYVEASVDGSGINEDIVNSVEEAGPGVEKAGEDHGEKYSDGFFGRLQKKIDESGIGKRLASKFGAGDSGEAAGENFLSRFTDKIERDDGSTLKKALARITKEIDGEDSGRVFSDGFYLSIQKKFGPHIATLLTDKMEAAGALSGKAFRDKFGSSLDDDALARVGDRLGTKVGNRLSDSLAKAITKGGKDSLSDIVDRVLAEAVSGNGSGRAGKADMAFGDRLGRLFGGGSRNNFLNTFGNSLGGLVKIADKVRGGVTSLFSTFAKGFSEAGEKATFLQKVMGGLTKTGSTAASGIGEAFSSLAASGPAAAVAVVVLVGALSALVSVVGALIGLVTALAATLASALVGALAVAGAGIAALVVAGGLLTAAFMSMTDAQKNALKADFRPLREEMIGIGQIIFKEMVPALGVMSENLQKALYLVTPLASVMGQAFGQAGKILTESFSGPGFQAFYDALGVNLPGIVTNLSSALGQFLNGLLGLFSVILPYVLQFSQYLNNVATDFANFANSAEGRNKIKDFVDRAVVSLISLWGAVQQVFGFISDLLFSPQAQEAGNTIFDGIASTFAHLRDVIAQAAADGSLKKFFDDAIEFGGQLWSVVEALVNVFMSLYNSGVLQGVGQGMGALAGAMNYLAEVLRPLVAVIGFTLPKSMGVLNRTMSILSGSAKGLGGIIRSLSDRVGLTSPQRNASGAWLSLNGVLSRTANGYLSLAQAAAAANLTVAGGNDLAKPVPRKTPSLPSLQLSGASALGMTDIPKPKAPKQYQNPYEAYANSLIKQGPSVRTQIAQALASLQKQVVLAFADAAKADTAAEARKGLSDIGKALVAQGKTLVDSAQQAINSAASQLASASSASDAARALAAVKRAQKDMAAAIAASKRLRKAQQLIAKQNVVSDVRVDKLLAGLKSKNATLADYAVAREKVAGLIKDANDKLTAAVALRTDFAKAVTDSVKSFGALTQAQAQTLNGVQQDLTAADITSTLQDRLDRIRAFQNNLLLLRAQGLSDAAYKQIVDAGVDGGSAYAQALIDGGLGSIQEVNSLVGQIDNLAATLGQQTSASLYDAGVNAAQGLIDGLTSLQAQINAAGDALGKTIALAIKKALGIHSPSTVLYAMMDDVGDGAVNGLDDQHSKLIAASKRFSDVIEVSPDAAARAGSPAAPGVSGNNDDPRFRDLIIQTPTEDPEAVARETLNELVGRL